MRTANAPHCPLFSPITHKPIHGYYTMVAFNELYKLGEQAKVELGQAGVYAVAARKGKNGCVVIANTNEKDIPLELEMNASDAFCYITANGSNEKRAAFPSVLPRESIVVIHTNIT